MNQKLSNLPYRGTTDLFGIELKKRQYIFNVWRQTCLNFGFQEYLTPLLEPAIIYETKSGEDVGKKQLYTLTDLKGRRLAIRPEMTPSVIRLVSHIYSSAPKPLRLFSIANFMRNERPQKGRSREFWQLNADIFGSQSNLSDTEIISLALSIMNNFKAPSGSFSLYINDRRIVDQVLIDIVGLKKDQTSSIGRILDKFKKLERPDFSQALTDLGLNSKQIETIVSFLKSDASNLVTNFPQLKDNPGYQNITQLIKNIKQIPLAENVIFQPSIIRGLDYYDDMVFEVFDNHPENNRSLFGGGRYNGLADIFGGQNIPAVGFAPGDITTKLFLEQNDLFPKDQISISVFLPVLDEKLIQATFSLASQLRSLNLPIVTSTEVTPLTKALQHAGKQKFSFILILGEKEVEQKQITIKNLETGDQQTLPLDQLIQKLSV